MEGILKTNAIYGSAYNGPLALWVIIAIMYGILVYCSFDIYFKDLQISNEWNYSLNIIRILAVTSSLMFIIYILWCKYKAHGFKLLYVTHEYRISVHPF